MVDSRVVCRILLKDCIENSFVLFKATFAPSLLSVLKKGYGVVTICGFDGARRMPIGVFKRAGLLRRVCKVGGVYVFSELDEEMLNWLCTYLCNGLVIVDERREVEFNNWAKLWRIKGFVSFLCNLSVGFHLY
jgi:hypothetical protein